MGGDGILVDAGELCGLDAACPDAGLAKDW